MKNCPFGVRSVDNAEEFLRLTENLRATDPVSTNLVTTIAESVRSGRRTWDRYFWWLVVQDVTGGGRSSGDEIEREEQNNNSYKFLSQYADESKWMVVGAALRTVPFGLLVTKMPLEAVPCLASAVASDDDDFPYIIGNEEVVKCFLDRYKAIGSPGSHKSCDHTEIQLYYTLGQLQPHTCREEFTVRTATLEDLDLTVDWMRKFVEELGLENYDIEKHCRGMISSGGLRLLSISADSKPPDQLADHTVNDVRLDSTSQPTPVAAACGIIVSMANLHMAVNTGGRVLQRIGPVYTSTLHRGRGFASALTNHLCQEILSRGAEAMLVTQAENTTSNALYQRLGFELAERVVRVQFTPK